MLKLFDKGVYLINGVEITDEYAGASPEEARKQTIAYNILEAHNTSSNMEQLEIRFDKLTSHDITFVGIIQTARASGLERFPMPYVLTNCHNSLCAVGGTINEDDHMFGLSCAKKYGGVYVPPHQAVIHQYAREMLAGGGKMILGSDSHTRYGALGTIAMGEGGPELVKQLLNKTYDIKCPEVVGIYLDGEPMPGVGPQDVALAIIGATFENGYVNNKVMEFVGPGVRKLSADFRIGIDVMTTETTCLSSIWQTDEEIEEFYAIHGRAADYKELHPGKVAYYDGMVYVNLSEIHPMIAMPFHPSNTYTIDEVNTNLQDILHDVEQKALVSLGGAVEYSLQDKIVNGKLYVEQGVIAGCAGGGYENICAATEIIRGKNIGADAFTFSVYPASTPIYMELVKNGAVADLMAAGTVIKTAFCGPCFGAGDTPANNAFSIRHSTRNFPNREGSKLQNGQISSVALMDARSIAATAANKGFLTSAADMLNREYQAPKYHFDSTIYKNRVFDSKGKADQGVDVVFGPNIKDWPTMVKLPENLLIKIVSEIHDPVTTTDELIPSGETSSYRSNPLGLAEFTLSRKDPAYVGRAKEVQKAQHALEAGANVEGAQHALEVGTNVEDAQHALEVSRNVEEAFSEIKPIMQKIQQKFPQVNTSNLGIGSAIFAVKPGDGSAREQAASCQKVLGGWANIANEYATKRYRSNLINWGMLPLLTKEAHDKLSYVNGDYILLTDIRKVLEDRKAEVTGYLIGDTCKELAFSLGDLTDAEREIILKGCLINYYRG